LQPGGWAYRRLLEPTGGFQPNSSVDAEQERLSELAKALLSRQDRRLLLQTHDLLEELLETKKVLRDKRLMKSIRESQGDVKGGRLYPIERLRRQLRTEGKL
jgi:hypothetical protein